MAAARVVSVILWRPVARIGEMVLAMEMQRWRVYEGGGLGEWLW